MRNKRGTALSRLGSVPGIYLFLLRNLRQQRSFIRKELDPILQDFQERNDGSLKKEDFKKIRDYYGLGVPAILGSVFCLLRNRKMDRKERTALSFLGGISGMLDDLFDDPEKDPEALREFISRPESLRPENSFEALLKQLYLEGLTAAENQELLKQQAVKVYEAQQQSLLQKDPGVSPEKAKQLTLEKGGASFIFYRFCLSHPLSKQEEKMLHQLGGLMQLGNDIFDIWEDRQAGIRTFATFCSDIAEQEEAFRVLLKEFFRLTRETAYDPEQQKQFLRITTLALSRVFVCLEQFRKLQSEAGFFPENHSRKQLICDMQKPGNQLRAISFYLKTAGDPENQDYF